jgi:biotin synthase-like enzyme
MNDAYIDVYNPIFETLQELYTRWQHTHTIKDRINPA